MSWVANVMVCVALEDAETVIRFSSWLEAEAPRRETTATGVGFLNPLSSDSHAWGGWKNPECAVFGGALNHADLDAVVAQFAAMPWRIPAAAQLLVQDQEESYFRLWMLRDGEVHQFAPGPPADDSAW